MEQNMCANEFRKSLPSLKAAQMLEHTLKSLADLDISDPPIETWLVYNLFCPISPSTRHCPLENKNGVKQVKIFDL